MSLMTDEHKTHLDDHGWVVIADVVPEEHRDRVIAATCDFLGIDREDRESWYKPQLEGHGIVPLHHHPALWAVRELPEVHAIFADIYGTEKLWSSVDRVSFKAPISGWKEEIREAPVHWDGDPRQDEPNVQGLVYLTDTPADQGGFVVVPEIYGNLESWLDGKTDAEIRRPDMSDVEKLAIGGTAGSLVIWRRNMPHTGQLNHGSEPRFVQYVTMQPAGDAAARLALKSEFLEKRAPAWALRQNVAGQENPEPGARAELSDLGQRLAGVEAW